ncbi:MAG: restriction endonuclease [Paracoccus denitrificans]|uniref:Restriction endonuclease n=1 Tax=Paracoccus denitrificans TaxID=266 RepID=A0A533ID31_PARDE|nr:MAG: restriction endonuclease [Paracoccus denitrificans]
MSELEVFLNKLGDRVRNHSETIATEEAAKTSIVLPFMQALGYDVFDPAEVIPEFTADAVGKKGEKVDYAIRIGQNIRILVECKGLATRLDRKHLSQLFRYFTVTEAKFAILTNGQLFEFYSDLEEPNKLDSKPFFTFDLLDISGASIGELRKFEKNAFDIDKILANAERLKYVSSIKKYLQSEFDEPSSELIKLVATSVYDGRLTQAVRDNLASAVKFAFRDLVRDAVQAKLSNALARTNEETTDRAVELTADPLDEVNTTQDEVEGMLTIRAIVRDILPGARVGLRDAKSYCAVLVDNNNRKPLARLHFDKKNWQLSLFDTDAEERVPVEGLDAIYQYADRLRATAERYKEAK